MKQRVCLFVLLVLASSAAYGSTWDDMAQAQAQNNEIVAKIIDVHMGEHSATVTFERKDGSGTQTVPVCSISTNQNLNNVYSDQEYSAFLTQRLNGAEQAKRNHSTVKVSMRGPWDPCFISVNSI